MITIKFVSSMIKLFIMRFYNLLLRTLGYTRVYDLDTECDITIFYYLIRFLSTINLPLKLDITYERLGICTYINGRYMRYICYNTKLLGVIKSEKNLSSKNYHTVKKIELIPITENIQKKQKGQYKHINNNDRIDITQAKNQLYDVDNFTRPYDMIKFCQIADNVFITYDKIDRYISNNIKSIIIYREYFDDDLMEFIKTSEEITIQK